jgi:hypothetical protein
LTQKKKIIRSEIKKQFQLKKEQEQLKITIKRMMTIFDIKIICQMMKSKDKLTQ